MKKNTGFIAFCVLVAVLLTGTVSAAAFTDVDENEEYAMAIDFVNGVGLMVGYGDGTFQPEKAVSRAEMATILCKMMGEDRDLKQDGSVFSDVPTSHWGNGYVVKAASLGYLSGYGNGKFGPDDTVTYEQALTMLVNALGYGEEAGKHGGYPDGYIHVACEQNINLGLAMEIGDEANRWQVAVMLQNVMVF